MKQILISAVVAAVVSIVVLGFEDTFEDDADDRMSAAVNPSASESTAQSKLSFTDALSEDVWVNASGTAGDDHRSLTNPENSICFITKIELSGVQSPDDKSSCVMQIDDFTGFWDLVATVEEGGRSHIRCNARCLVWE
jgi:hypothetical protein